MNLYAYQKIEQLQPIADENGIKIPRLRGYLLMKKEDKYSNSEIEALIKSERDYVYEISFVSTNDKKEMMRAVKNADALVRKKTTTFNKYVGQDVLYIHARLGGENWENYGCQWIEKMDWFLEKVDDFFDGTYCDIYAKIKVTDNYLKLLEGS